MKVIFNKCISSTNFLLPGDKIQNISINNGGNNSKKDVFQKQPDDEDFLVDNEEEMDLKEEPYKVPISKEYLGKMQYKVGKIEIFN